MESSINSVESDLVYKTNNLGFAQANTFNRLLFSSGQVGWDNNYQLTGNGSFNDQLNQTFKNLNAILDEVNSTFEDVLMMRIYVKNLNTIKRNKIGEILSKYYPNTHKPASSLIGVASLAREDLLIEIEIISISNK